jgi:hypothetical protein
VTRPVRRRRTAALRGAAAAGLLAGSAVAVGVPVSTAHAADSICVALVVDFADLGNGVDTNCAKVPAGSSGEDVLRAAGHTLGFRPTQPGFVCTIDGWPREGCSASNGDHYWAYFHRAPGSSSWVYSTSGASGYRPADNSTEGWVWQTRDDQTPADVAFSSICTTTTAGPTPAPRRSTAASGSKTRSRPAARTTATATATASGPAAEQPTGDAAKAPRSRAKASRSSSPEPDRTAAPVASTDPPDAVADSALTDGDGDGSPPFGLLAGGVVVGGLGIAAAVRARRNRVDP